ncbi:MAG: GTPase HflX [Clostridia bacterium]
MQENEKALLIGVNVNGEKNFKQSMEELVNLTKACNIDVGEIIEQNLNSVNRSLYIGTGKVEEVKKEIDITQADLVIFNNELSSSQLRNLQKLLDIPILDRTALILQIFAKRAQTKESKLQVEVAKLQYMLPRLVGLHSSLGRQGGGAGLSNKGSGEKKLELDKRKIEDKLIELRKELENILGQRDIQRRKRVKSNEPLVSLVGYTNAGKSTLLNTLVEIYQKQEEKKVLEKDMLFATLETSVRNIILGDNKSFLLSDTVGFIDKLPHNLIKAFRSTLEEIKSADLLLHVIDYSDPNFDLYIDVTKETLKELGADNIPVIYIYNKSDLMLDKLPLIDGNSIYMSASKKQGVEELIQMIEKEIFSNYINCKMLIPFSKGNIISYFNEVATIKSTEYTQDGTLIEVECKQSDYSKYIEFVIKSKS